MFMCQYFIVAYLLVNIVGREFFGMPEIEAGYPMIAALLVSSVSFLVLRLYFDKKKSRDDRENQDKRVEGTI